MCGRRSLARSAVGDAHLPRVVGCAATGAGPSCRPRGWRSRRCSRQRAAALCGDGSTNRSRSSRRRSGPVIGVRVAAPPARASGGWIKHPRACCVAADDPRRGQCWRAVA
eukprot:scaffold1419_cov410-Prasinococcus_capsulatus_cf.AAC.21